MILDLTISYRSCSNIVQGHGSTKLPKCTVSEFSHTRCLFPNWKLQRNFQFEASNVFRIHSNMRHAASSSPLYNLYFHTNAYVYIDVIHWSLCYVCICAFDCVHDGLRICWRLHVTWGFDQSQDHCYNIIGASSAWAHSSRLQASGSSCRRSIFKCKNNNPEASRIAVHHWLIFII